jgi:hypothetical protein
MQRDSRAYLADILESCDAISTALSSMQIGDYLSNRLVRSSVEREFIIIGEAVLALWHKAPDIFKSISNAMVDLQVLRSECAALVLGLDSAD